MSSPYRYRYCVSGAKKKSPGTVERLRLDRARLHFYYKHEKYGGDFNLFLIKLIGDAEGQGIFKSCGYRITCFEKEARNIYKKLTRNTKKMESCQGLTLKLSDEYANLIAKRRKSPTRRRRRRRQSTSPSRRRSRSRSPSRPSPRRKSPSA